MEINKSELIKLIERFPEKAWNWYIISSNPNVTMEFIEKHPKKTLGLGIYFL